MAQLNSNLDLVNDPSNIEPSGMFCNYEGKDLDSKKIIISNINSFAELQTNLQNPRLDLLTCCLSETIFENDCNFNVDELPESERKKRMMLYLTEIFEKVNFEGHLSDIEGDLIEEMFTKKCIKTSLNVHLNPPEHHDGAMNSVKTLGGKIIGIPMETHGYLMNPYKEMMLGGKWGTKLLANKNQLIFS